MRFELFHVSISSWRSSALFELAAATQILLLTSSSQYVRQLPRLEIYTLAFSIRITVKLVNLSQKFTIFRIELHREIKSIFLLPVRLLLFSGVPWTLLLIEIKVLSDRDLVDFNAFLER